METFPSISVGSSSDVKLANNSAGSYFRLICGGGIDFHPSNIKRTIVSILQIEKCYCVFEDKS